MNVKSRFTKNNTLAMKGIAISFLLFYHCFSKKSRMGGMYVDFAPLSRGTAMMISRCMVQCVGLFAFLSVYGLTRSVKKKYQSYEFSGQGRNYVCTGEISASCPVFYNSVFFLYGCDVFDRYIQLCKRTGKYTGEHCYGFFLCGISV